jgi:hypothetical protein
LNTNQEQVEGKLKEEIIVEEYTADFLFKTTSNNASCHDSIGINHINLFKEKFKEYELKQVQLLQNSPEEN